ncbi:MAG: SDR family NAD(P)-dependent oxidoreductase [Dehalococcoidia bacterium]|nr:SDR family NAD(P)-dependent oxidoreductase [Dehalococcoidia bacterium]
MPDRGPGRGAARNARRRGTRGLHAPWLSGPGAAGDEDLAPACRGVRLPRELWRPAARRVVVSGDAPVAVITGASRGIGKQFAVDFAAAGYDVVCLARSTDDSPTKLPGTVDETAQLVRDAGRRALALPLNVQVEEEVAAIADRVYDELGRCDVLINNAAIAIPGKTLELPTSRWRLAMDVNVHGPLYMMYHFCPRMVQAGSGRVINISSGAAVRPEFGRISYTVTKRALEALTEGMGFELQEQSVAVNCIRLDFAVWSEGYAYTLPGVDTSEFEDPVVMSDAALWLARQPLDYTGKVLAITQMREMGAVRGNTRIADREGWGDGETAGAREVKR